MFCKSWSHERPDTVQVLLAGEERIVWVRVGSGMGKVRCRPDIDVADLAELIKETFKPKLDECAAPDLTLTFSGTQLKAHELIADAIRDTTTSGEEPVPVIVATP